jgi:hypothetical protein
VSHLLTLLAVAVFRKLVASPSFEFSISCVICAELGFKIRRAFHEFIATGSSTVFGVGAVSVLKSLVEKVVLIL